MFQFLFSFPFPKKYKNEKKSSIFNLFLVFSAEKHIVKSFSFKSNRRKMTDEIVSLYFHSWINISKSHGIVHKYINFNSFHSTFFQLSFSICLFLSSTIDRISWVLISKIVKQKENKFWYSDEKKRDSIKVQYKKRRSVSCCSVFEMGFS